MHEYTYVYVPVCIYAYKHTHTYLDYHLDGAHAVQDWKPSTCQHEKAQKIIAIEWRL
jgi:hypothetical protein